MSSNLARFTPPTAPESSPEPPKQEIFRPWIQVKSQTPTFGTSSPLPTDSAVEAPQLGSDRTADPNFVRVGNVDEAETGGDALIAQAQQDNKGTEAAREKVEGPAGALGHYILGSGKTVEFPFDRIVTKDVEPAQFPAVRNILRQGQPGSYKIEGKMPFSAPNYDARYLVGNITLNINGTLVLDEDGTYSFKGELGAEPDRYRFYSSDHRDTTAEIATQIGTLLPGREFTVVISGRRPVSADGRYLPPAVH